MTWLRWVAVLVTVTSLAGFCVAAFGHWPDADLARRTAGLMLFAAVGTLATWALIEVFIDISEGRHNG
jgi:hypothetical protein